jgi:hypothetical protein
MELVLLDSQVADWLQNIFSSVIAGTDDKLQDSFGGVYQSVLEFSNGLVAVGIFISAVYLIAQFLMTSQLDYSAVLKLLVMLTVYLAFTATVDIKKGSSIMAVISRMLDSFESTVDSRLAKDKSVRIDEAFQKGQEQGLKDEDTRIKQEQAGAETKMNDASTSFISQTIMEVLTAWIFNFFDMIAEILLVVCSFLIVFVSKFGCWLLIAFAPFSAAVSFIKGFEGSFIGMLKYFIVFKLWSVIVVAIKAAMFNLGFSEQIAFAKAQGAVSVFNSPSMGVIVMKLCYCLIVIMTPMFADILISGSQSGSFFSSAIGKAGGLISGGAAAGGTAGGAIAGNRISNIGKNFGHAGGAIGIGEKLKDIKSPGALVSGMKKMMHNPGKNDHKY